MIGSFLNCAEMSKRPFENQFKELVWSKGVFDNDVYLLN